MAVRNTVITDNFNRADDADLGANWTAAAWAAGGLEVFANNARPPSSNEWRAEFYSGGSPLPEHQWAEVIVSSVHQDFFYIMLLICLDGTGGGGYALVGDRTGLSLTGNSLSEATGVTFADGDKHALEKFGAALRVFKNDSLVFSHTDPSPLTGGGRVGMGCNAWDYTGGLSLDNFAAGGLDDAPLGGPSPLLTVLRTPQDSRGA
jgi:hypothetical protein